MATIDDRVAEAPIQLPENPYTAALKEFGGDEALAGVIDAAATTAASYVLSPACKPFILPFVGPVIEKVGFFPLHLRKAYKLYKTMPPSRREPLLHYFKQAIRNGSANLAKDLLIHDPLYISFMAGGLQLLPTIPAGVLSAGSYVTAIMLVAAIDVIKDELRHSMQNKQLTRAGFHAENYYEARFCIKTEQDPAHLLERLRNEFSLREPQSATYRDRYFTNTFKSFSGRTVKARLRQRQSTPYERQTKGFPRSDSLQVVFTRAHEHNAGVDQCRYFVTRKEKLWYATNERPATIADMTESPAKQLASRYTNGETRDVTFTRTVCGGPELAVCTDSIKTERPFYILEIKTWKDKTLLQQAMRYIMVECPIVSIQTTKGKFDLTEQNCS